MSRLIDDRSIHCMTARTPMYRQFIDRNKRIYNQLESMLDREITYSEYKKDWRYVYDPILLGEFDKSITLPYLYNYSYGYNQYQRN